MCSWAAPCSLAGAQEAVRRIDGSHARRHRRAARGRHLRPERPAVVRAADSGTNGYTVVLRKQPRADRCSAAPWPVTGWHDGRCDQRHLGRAGGRRGSTLRQLYVDGRQVPRSSGLPSATYIQSTTGFTHHVARAGQTGRNVSNVSAVFEGGNGAVDPDVVPLRVGGGDTITMAEPCWGNLHLPADGSQEVAWVDGPQGGFGGLSRSGPTVLLREHARAADARARGPSTPWRTRCTTSPPPARTWRLPPCWRRPCRRSSTVQGSLCNPVRDLALSGLTVRLHDVDPARHRPGLRRDAGRLDADRLPRLVEPGHLHLLDPGWHRARTPRGRYPRRRAPLGHARRNAVGDTFTRTSAEQGLDVCSTAVRTTTSSGNVFDDIAANAIQLGSTDDPLPSDVGAAQRRDRRRRHGGRQPTSTTWPTSGSAASAFGSVTSKAPASCTTRSTTCPTPPSASAGPAGTLDALSPDSDPNVNADNVIADNLLYDDMQQLGDGGAIYTNGGQATDWAGELMISGNVNYGGTNTDFSYYTDTGSQVRGARAAMSSTTSRSTRSPPAAVTLSGTSASTATGSPRPARCTRAPRRRRGGQRRHGGVRHAAAGPGARRGAGRGRAGAGLPVTARRRGAVGRIRRTRHAAPGGWRRPDRWQRLHPVAPPSPSAAPRPPRCRCCRATTSIAAAPAGSSGTAAVAVTTAAGSSAAASMASVSYSSTPSPCVPYLGGNFSTALAPAGPSLPSGSPSPSPPSPSSPPPSLPSPSSLPTPWLPVVPSPPL